MNIKSLVIDKIKGREQLLKTKQGRIALTKFDPLLFAWIYLPNHITAEDGSMTMNEFHMELINYGTDVLTASIDKPAEFRHTFIAPRNTGKSTWMFTILPIWAAAHGHQKFIAAFSDSSTQAEEHLKTFMAELQDNDKLKEDFPLLCAPKMGGYRERIIAANRHQYIAANGFIFMVRGADNSVLGMKVGTLRPTWIILDDIEKDESNYSDALVYTRLKTLQDAIFPLNVYAKVTVVGTTTKPGAILDQIRKVSVMRKEYDGTKAEFREDLPQELRWVVDENFTCKHIKALISENGSERSLWPEKWPLEWLQGQRHTRSFAKNYQCEPISEDAGYWNDGDFTIIGHNDWPEDWGNTLISVDPAVTTNKRSDFTGIAIVSKQKNGKMCYIRHVEQVKMGPAALKVRVQELIDEYDAKLVYVETNQGGDLWKQVFEGITAKVKTVKQYEKKEERARRVHDLYQKSPAMVVHTAHWPAAEEQMMNFPKGLHDDMVDAISTGVLYFMRPNTKVIFKQSKYI